MTTHKKVVDNRSDLELAFSGAQNIAEQAVVFGKTLKLGAHNIKSIVAPGATDVKNKEINRLTNQIAALEKSKELDKQIEELKLKKQQLENE